MDPETHPRWGYEFDWFAVDSIGQIGAFSTHGAGSVPAAVMDHVDALDVWFWPEQRNTLPIIGECAHGPHTSGDDSYWVDATSRGLFLYAWDVASDGPYHRWAVPSRPVHVDEIPPDLASLARLVPLPIDFTATTWVELNTLGVSTARGKPSVLDEYRDGNLEIGRP